MKTVDCLLLGYGNVGGAFYRLLKDKDDDLRKAYGLGIRMAAVFRKSAGCIFSGPKPAGELPETPAWDRSAGPRSLLKASRPGVVVECLSSDYSDGEPGLSLMTAALNSGWHVVAADKAPLVKDFHHLSTSAAKNGVQLKISGATAAALPILDVAQYSLAGARIISFEGILNGTSNYILTRMGEGLDYERALAEAQEKGIAEPDPRYDVEGRDTASKLLLLARSLWGDELDPADIDVKGIDALTKGVLREARAQGRALKLLGKAARTGEGVKAAVVPMAVGPDHHLFGVRGEEKGITFWTDTLGTVTVTGGKSDPRGAAAALLKDLINIYR